MSTPPDYFDVNAEPANFPGRFEPDPTEQIVPFIDGHEDEIATLRDSVLNEPAFSNTVTQTELTRWIRQKRSRCTLVGNWSITLLAALAAGPFAVLGAFMTGRQTIYALLYAVLFAPVVEELLKQSGMIYLLEKKPYRLFTAWQFIIAAAISAAVFAAIENVFYFNFYVNLRALDDPQAFILWRWTVCVGLHVTCSVIASFGLIRVWKRQLADGRAADLGYGFVPFAVAMGLHGLYNLSVSLFHPHF